jgi:hypothetical protein
MERKVAMEKKVLPKEPALSRKPRRKASVVVGGADGRVIEVAGAAGAK